MPSDPRLDLEGALVDLGRSIEFPPTPDLASRVVASLGTTREPRPRWWRAAAIAAAVLVVAAVVTVAFPSARRAVADWLGIDGIRIEFDDSPSGPAPGDDLALGRRVTLSEARSLVDFDLAVPSALGEPDGVFHNRYVAGGEVTMTYRPNARLKESGHTEVGALFSQFVGSLEPSAVKKIVHSGTRVIGVEIHGAPGWWIEGRPHLLYLWTDGAVRDVTSRLAGNTLVWQRDGIAYRLEARTTRAEAVEIARSVD